MTTSSLRSLAVILLAGWLLMTPRGPVMHDGAPVRFASAGDCLDTALWLNGQAGVAWYWCEEEAAP